MSACAKRWCQGQCGSCWTFGTTETVEAYWAMKTGNLQELSEQFVLDCTANPNDCGGTGGCGVGGRGGGGGGGGRGGKKGPTRGPPAGGPKKHKGRRGGGG